MPQYVHVDLNIHNPLYFTMTMAFGYKSWSRALMLCIHTMYMIIIWLLLFSPQLLVRDVGHVIMSSVRGQRVNQLP